MDIAEIKRETRYKFETVMGSFDFIDEKVNEIKMQLIAEEKKTADLVKLLLYIRTFLREKKEFAIADMIRQELLLKIPNIKIEDDICKIY